MKLRFLSVAFVSWSILGLAWGCTSESDDCEVGICAAAAGTGGVGMSGNGGTTGKGGKGGGGGTASAGDSGSAGEATAGNGGEPGGAGGEGGSEPCDGACGGDTPVCDVASETCVECLGPLDCDPSLICDTASNTCVECVGNADCIDPATSKCDGGVCVGCGASEDCSHIDGKTVCDTDATECVECMVADESPCGGNSCNPATNACTDTAIGSLSSCQPCVADSECAGGGTADPDQRCVLLDFEGSTRDGGYCLRRQSKTCSRPYTVSISSGSVSGAPAETYCGVNEATVTCEAVRDLATLGASCPLGQDSECGCIRDSEQACIGSGLGGLCETVSGVPNTCTYACAIPLECPGTLGCDVFCK